MYKFKSKNARVNHQTQFPDYHFHKISWQSKSIDLELHLEFV